MINLSSCSHRGSYRDCMDIRVHVHYVNARSLVHLRHYIALICFPFNSFLHLVFFLDLRLACLLPAFFLLDFRLYFFNFNCLIFVLLAASLLFLGSLFVLYFSSFLSLLFWLCRSLFLFLRIFLFWLCLLFLFRIFRLLFLLFF